MRGLGEAATVVLGNHDLHLLAVAAGVRAPNRSDTLDKILKAPDRDALIGWLHEQPLLHQEHGYTMVHAGIPPQWSVKQARKYAAEVEAVLRSPDCVEFFRHMYGNEPAVWSDELQGMERLRLITNYLTRMRYCTSDGVLDLESKGPSPDPGSKKKVTAWFSHPGRKTAWDRILFGHWVTPLGKVGDAFVLLLQMPVLPYVAVSLVVSLGRLDYKTAGELAIRGGLLLLILWALSLAMVALYPLSFPRWESASFFSTSSLEALRG